MAAATTLIVSAIKAAACRMRSCLEDTCSQAGMAWPAQSLPNTLMVCFPGVDGRLLLPALDLAGVEASQGSACSSGSPMAHRVLLAMGLDAERARACVRFSFAAAQDTNASSAAGLLVARVLAQLRQHSN